VIRCCFELYLSRFFECNSVLLAAENTAGATIAERSWDCIYFAGKSILYPLEIPLLFNIIYVCTFLSFALIPKACKRHFKFFDHEMQTIVTDLSSVCVSRDFAVQTQLNKLRSCLGWRLLGTQGTLLDGGSRFPPWIRCSLCQITLAICYILNSLMW